jgi:hypothetical protein
MPMTTSERRLAHRWRSAGVAVTASITMASGLVAAAPVAAHASAITVCDAGAFQAALPDGLGSLSVSGDAPQQSLTGRYAEQQASNPTIAGLPQARGGNFYQVAYPGISRDLYLLNSNSEIPLDTGVPVMWHSTPGLAELPAGTPGYPNGGYIAVVNNDGNLWDYNSSDGAGTLDATIAGAPGPNGDVPTTGVTSPAVVATPNGPEPVQVAWQNNNSDLWISSGKGAIDTHLSMMPGTSPSIAMLQASSPAGSSPYVIAFQNSAGQLVTYGPTIGTENWGLFMDTQTSPSITALANGFYAVAFQNTANQLAVIVGGPGIDPSNVSYRTIPGVTLLPSNSPSIASFPNDTYDLAYENRNLGAGVSDQNGNEIVDGVHESGGMNPAITSIQSAFC